MKVKLRTIQVIFGVSVILLSFMTITINSLATSAPLPAEPWKIDDEDCEPYTVTNGDTTFYSGTIRHCLYTPEEQCNSHICRAHVPIEE